jgi:hypothetical protein
MRVYRVAGYNINTDGFSSKYLVSEDEKSLLGPKFKYEPVEVEEAIFMENKRQRSMAFSDLFYKSVKQTKPA